MFLYGKVYGALVQLVRIQHCHCCGHRFEPGTHRQVLGWGNVRLREVRGS